MLAILAYLTWDLNPIIAHLGPITPRWYGLFFMSGFVVGTFVLTHIYRSERVSPRWVDVITIYMLVGTIVGARMGHVLFYEPEIITEKGILEVFKVWHGGLASHGATIGILLACWLFARKNKFDYLWVLDRIVIVVGIGGALIRTGNFMNSEIVGHPSTAPWAVVFPRDAEHLLPATNPLPAGAVLVQRQTEPDGSVVMRPAPAGTPVTPGGLMAVPRHPTQLYEALYCVLLVSLLYYLWNRTRERTPRGLLFGLFVVLLFTQRFLGEFLKEAQVDFEKGHLLNQGQLLSIPMVLIGIWVLWRAGKDPENPYGYAPRDLDEAEANASLPRPAVKSK